MTATVNPTITLPTPPIKQAKLYINGQWRAASDGKTRPTISPITETVIAEIPEASEQDVEDAILAARRAFDHGPWAKMSGHQRQQILTRASELMEKYADDLALCETLDMGKAIYFAKTFDARFIADLFRYYAGMAPEIDGATRLVAPPPEHTPKHVTIVREPLGVVAAITPFNFPLVLAGTKIAPALAAGNTIIHKPASATPLSAIKLAEIFEEAGLAAGVYNLITGSGSRVGDQLVKHPVIDKISFTGSTEVGIGIIHNSAEPLKKTTMELGGKSFATRDTEAALATMVADAYVNDISIGAYRKTKEQYGQQNSDRYRRIKRHWVRHHQNSDRTRLSCRCLCAEPFHGSSSRSKRSVLCCGWRCWHQSYR